MYFFVQTHFIIRSTFFVCTPSCLLRRIISRTLGTLCPYILNVRDQNKMKRNLLPLVLHRCHMVMQSIRCAVFDTVAVFLLLLTRYIPHLFQSTTSKGFPHHLRMKDELQCFTARQPFEIMPLQHKENPFIFLHFFRCTICWRVCILSWLLAIHPFQAICHKMVLYLTVYRVQ